MDGVQTGRRGFLASGLLLLTLFAEGAFCLMAQEDDAGGGAAFAGGNMVQGTVTVVAGNQLKLKTEAGEVYQVAVSANTRLSKDGQPLKMTAIKAGDGVGAVGVLDAPTQTIHAVFVGVMDAAQVKKAREDLGKVYIVGKVTAIDMDGLKLTVVRPDRVTQIIGVDEGTSFRRGGRGMGLVASGGGGEVGSIGEDRRGNKEGTRAPSSGESITLADVKVGDSIAGRGALKRGVFVPTELRVMDPAARGQRRRRAEDDGSAGAAAAPPK